MFLAYNSKQGVDFQQSKKVKEFQAALTNANIPNEYYQPPGWDIGSSCGQFLMDYYTNIHKPSGYPASLRALTVPGPGMPSATIPSCS